MATATERRLTDRDLAILRDLVARERLAQEPEEDVSGAQCESRSHWVAAERHPRLPGLSRQQGDAAELHARGWKPKQIGLQMGINAGTVRVHLLNARAKCGVATSAELADLVRLALREPGLEEALLRRARTDTR
jgi:DNA-binding NarL/FixJ family response regulator